MAADRKYIDTENRSNLGEIAQRRGPSGHEPDTVPKRSDQEIAARWERIRELAGSLKGVISDDFIEENYRQRLVPSFRSLDW